MKKFASLLLVVALLAAMLTVFAVPAFAEGVTKPDGAEWLVDEGDNHVWWQIDNGTLTVGGKGAMPDFYSFSDQPWFNISGTITAVQVLSGVTSIGNSAFMICSTLTSVTIPSGVTRIGDCAFLNCSKLTSVTIPSGVTSIGDNAFAGCQDLTSATIPASVTRIPDHAFSNCQNLTSVTIPASVTSIGSYAFSACQNLTSLTVKAITPPTLKDDRVFDGTRKLVAIYVPYGTGNDYKSADIWKTAEISDKIKEAYIVDIKRTKLGTVTVDKDCFPVSDFATGQTVTVTVIPNEGSLLSEDSLLVEYREDGSKKTITPTQDKTDPTKYRFEMPAANVTVGLLCKHDFGDGHVCTKCGSKDCELGEASHTWDEDTGKCSFCGADCEHIWDESTGKCSVCGIIGCKIGERSHKWSNGKCTLCGTVCKNIFHDGVCPDCGMGAAATGSTLSEGSLTIICSVACLAVGFLAAMFIFKKKKPELVSGAENTDEE